jgi:hypothetical protein
VAIYGNQSGAGILITGGATGHGISARGGTTSGDGIHAEALGVGDGIEAVGLGGGFDIHGDIEGDLSGTIGGLTPGERDLIAAALLDLANGVVTGVTVRQNMRLLAASQAGKLSGAGSGTIIIRDLNDTKDVVTATTDPSGNRLTIVLDLS